MYHEMGVWLVNKHVKTGLTLRFYFFIIKNVLFLKWLKVWLTFKQIRIVSNIGVFPVQ